MTITLITLFLLFYFSKYKNIKNEGKTFLHRFSWNLPKGSIKLHIIVNNDIKPHTHPWDFISIIIFGGYKEKISKLEGYENIDKTIWMTEIKHHPLSIIKRKMNTIHLVNLYNIKGYLIPCITLGYYNEKKQLCSLCQELGYCKSKKN